MNKNKLTAFIFLTLFLSNALGNQTTLLCSGQISAKNASGQQRSGQVSTTVEFSEERNFFRINNTDNLARAVVNPYTEVNFFDESIHWKTSVDQILGNGTFFGSINRKTGEMTSNFFVIEKTGGMVSISGSLFCEKRTSNRF